MRSYYRGDSSFIATCLKRLHQVTLGNFNWYKLFLRFLILKTGGNDVQVRNIFDTYKPDLLVCLSLTNYDFDVMIAREARKRGVRIFGMVRSWDNLSSHGLLRVIPDIFVLQNEFLKDMAEQHQAISFRNIPVYVIGLPHYDLIVDINSVLRPREEFLRNLGLDPSKKIIFYGAMGEFLFIHEGELPCIFDQLVKDGQLPRETQFIYRAHPKFPVKGEVASSLKHVVLDTAGKYIDMNNKNISLNQNEYLINSLYHSDVVTTGASTIAIDAAIIDKPTVCVAFDGSTPRERVNYWESVERFYDRYTHFEELVDTGGVKIAYSPKEYVMAVRRYLKNPNLEQAERRKIVNRLVAPFDGKASERLVELLFAEIVKIHT
jgi:hypothetical protein